MYYGCPYSPNKIKSVKMKEQLELGLIKHEVSSGIIPQRMSDGYVNATEMCAAAGKKFSHYNSLNGTSEFLDALSVDTGITASNLMVIIRGGNRYVQGTWVHPLVAIHLAQWCSPQFAVAVSKLVFEWMRGEFTTTVVPYHIERYMANMSEIPPTHFSMLNELTFNLIAPLEVNGYTLPEQMVPDISEGRMFCGWLRKEKNIEPNDFPTYKHRYADGRVVDAKLYPNSLLEDFRKHFHEVWMPKRMLSYFQERDSNAVPHIEHVFASLLITG